MSRFKRIMPYKEDIFKAYLELQNISEVSRLFNIHYSNLRRFIKVQIKEADLEDMFNLQYFNVEDFPYLEIGDTFQFGANLTIWEVIEKTEKENDTVWALRPTKTISNRHWLDGDMVTLDELRSDKYR